jgi:hypothetical protein
MTRATLESSPRQHSARTKAIARWLSLAILAGSLLAGAALRLWLALTDDGVHWPDEIYQSLEPAHRAVFGYGLLAWEFLEGARHWAFPGMIAGVLEVFKIAGLDSPRVYLTTMRILFCGVGVATSLVVYRFARGYGAQALAAACGSACFSLMNVAIYFAPRAMSETAAALPATAGLALSILPGTSRRQLWVGGSLLGISVLLRLQCALFCLGALTALWARGSRRAALELTSVLAIWAVIFGLVDRLTWGQWFHSAWTYVRFNLLAGGAVRFGRSPPNYYTRTLLETIGPLWVLVACFAVLAVRRARPLWGIALLFFVVHWLSPHKELRFLAPLFPLWCVLAAVGLQVAMDSARWLRVAAPAVLLALAVDSAVRYRQLTFQKFGLRYMGTGSALDAGGPENRLLLAAHDVGDLCGLKVISKDLDYLGAFSFLHRRVPLYGPSGPDADSRRFNYVIAPRATVAGKLRSEQSGLALTRIFEGPCAPDPSYNWHLN